MNALIIEKTKETPEINFNPTTGVLQITGRAYSNDIYQLFKPLNSWQDQYLANPKNITTIELRIEYCNTIFNKLLLIFLETSKTVLTKNKQLVIKWYYEKGDKESMDDANHNSKLIDFPIEKVEY
ncbi:hypothetical protein BH10BAC1_BH10BAC1_21180 [soil metagenome]